MPEEPKHQFGVIAARIPAGYSDITTYEFVSPRKSEPAIEDLMIAVGEELARANCGEVAAEILARVRNLDAPLKIQRDEAARISDHEAHVLDYELEASHFVSRRVIVDLRKHRFLQAIYTTSPDPPDAEKRWEAIVGSLCIRPATSASVTVGFRRREFPEFSINVPENLDRAELYKLRKGGGATLLLGILPFDHPERSGTIIDDADRPEVAAKIMDRKSESRSMPEGALVIDRYRVPRRDDPDSIQRIIRIRRIFIGRLAATVEVRGTEDDQTLDADGISLAESIQVTQ